MGIPTLAGITAKTVTTSRMTTRALFAGPEDGIPVLFIHGGPTSGGTWAPLVPRVKGFRCLVLDRPGTGLSDPLPVPVLLSPSPPPPHHHQKNRRTHNRNPSIMLRWRLPMVLLLF